MREIMYQLDWTSLLIFFLTTAGGAALLWYRKAFSEWRRFWRSVLDGLRAIPTLERDVKGIMQYVAPNGGGSLADSAKRTEESLRLLAEQLELVVQIMVVGDDADETLGRFHTDESGANISVNRIYARWLGVGKLDLLGWKFLNFVHPEDVARIRAHWDECREENRPYRATHRMIAADGEVIVVEVSATPIPDSPPAKRWVGILRRVDDA